MGQEGSCVNKVSELLFFTIDSKPIFLRMILLNYFLTLKICCKNIFNGANIIEGIHIKNCFYKALQDDEIKGIWQLTEHSWLSGKSEYFAGILLSASCFNPFTRLLNYWNLPVMSVKPSLLYDSFGLIVVGLCGFFQGLSLQAIRKVGC